jgi:multiple RNA-binding domain-containing protein 1
MMAKGKKAKTQTWNESFNDFIPSNKLKSRRERKREEKAQKEQEVDDEEEGHHIKIGKKEVIEAEGGTTIVQKEINRKSTKLGAKKAKQIHIKFGGKADIDAAMEKIEENLETNEEPKQQDENKEGEGEEDGEEIDQNRLFVMNLPFEITEEELREYFGRYGEIDEISIPLRRGGVGTGFCFVRFMEPEAAANAYANLDKKIFQGRILTIMPASKKKEEKKPEEPEEPKEPEVAENIEEKKEEFKKQIDEKSSFKTNKKVYMKRNFDDETNWNYLFMSQDAVTEAIANKLSLKKGDILNKDDDNLAVRVANIETQIIKETKDWMAENGINLKAIERKNNRKDCKRSKTMLLIKNISPKVTLDDLTLYLQTTDVIISPSSILAIAKYKSASQAESVMKKM